jgi:tetratricopeptide (TPR) repeat protein
MAQLTLGRALQMSGSAEEAVIHLEEARQRFERLAQPRMANTALTDKADCLTDLGRYDEAAEAYEEGIRISEQLEDPRGAAVSRGQLATVRMYQKRYPEALGLYDEARKIFQKLGEPRTVAVAWHQIGRVHEAVGQYEAAEAAYQESLKIEVQTGNRTGEAQTLNQLGNLYSRQGRREEAVRFYRQAAEVFVDLRDLRSEGATRNNVADKLVKLKRYDEARVELQRAIECKRPFGHVAEPWTTFQILSNLEREIGNAAAARQARDQAIQAYLSYRRAGGASQTGLALQTLGAVTQLLSKLRQYPDPPPRLQAFLAAIEAVLAGSRDPHFADDPNLTFDDAAELLLLIESLPTKATSA